ncbi:MAG TPA: helix-turn-helix transcriptional regulator [Solirubrobacterales bacterium]|jgi:transcriptional regulator with XRE-family HTH domain|nr:helix-turn-helix transcriptional regulator [Solirubrobacterales bacterium]
MVPGELLREARRRYGISQERLAIRAGTTQSAISRIESNRVSPSFETLRSLLALLGEELTIGSERPDTGIDLSLNDGNLQLSPSGRLRKGLRWADMVRRGRGGENPSAATRAYMANTNLGEGLELHPLLGVLIRHRVDFVVVGGVAGWIHGSVYPTYDLDVAYARDRGNLERLAAALAELKVRWRGGPPELPVELSAAMLQNGANFTFETPFGHFDVLGDLSGVRDYEVLRREARIESYDGLDIRVASIDHLIAMKRSANRPKDRLMLLEYTELANRVKPDRE